MIQFIEELSIRSYKNDIENMVMSFDCFHSLRSDILHTLISFA